MFLRHFFNRFLLSDRRSQPPGPCAMFLGSTPSSPSSLPKRFFLNTWRLGSFLPENPVDTIYPILFPLKHLFQPGSPVLVSSPLPWLRPAHLFLLYKQQHIMPRHFP